MYKDSIGMMLKGAVYKLCALCPAQGLVKVPMQGVNSIWQLIEV